MIDNPVPVFARAMTAFAAVLAKAEAHCVAHKIDPAVMVSMRLFPNMLPLTRQVQIATDAAKGACARLAGVEVPSMPDDEVTFADLQARLAKTQAFIATLTREQFVGAATRQVKLRTGGQEHSFTGAAYLAGFAIPNYYFHMTTAYNILRHNGVELGKMDYLGAP